MSKYFENPSAVLDESTVREKGEPRFHGSIEEIVRKICQGNWSKATSTLTIEPLTGGISNILYLVTLNGNGIAEEEKVVVRLFGLGTEKFIDRTV